MLIKMSMHIISIARGIENVEFETWPIVVVLVDKIAALFKMHVNSTFVAGAAAAAQNWLCSLLLVFVIRSYRFNEFIQLLLYSVHCWQLYFAQTIETIEFDSFLI